MFDEEDIARHLDDITKHLPHAIGCSYTDMANGFEMVAKMYRGLVEQGMNTPDDVEKTILGMVRRSIGGSNDN